jgi:Flp pilus assembly protein TadG
MLSPLIRRRKSTDRKDARSKERGVTLALIAAAMVAIIGMAALSIDIGTLYQAKAEAQRAADAAALTAARVISLSGVTGDPDTTTSWFAVCGPTGAATVAASAIAKAQWNFIGGAAAPTVTVTYGTGAGVTDCSTLAGSTSSFTVNPIVTVYVKQPSVPTFFGRIFSLIPGGTSSNSGVSATATAEVYNPSGSASPSVGSGVMVPVQPRCVKPWIVPDSDPIHPAMGTCIGPGTGTGTVCSKFVDPVGTISTTGTILETPSGVIGETFNLVPDCGTTGLCNSGAPYNPLLPAEPNVPTTPPSTPNLQYLPALVQNSSPAAATCAAGDYQQAIAGCDNTTPYQCGVPFSTPGATPTQVDLNENPYGATGDTSVGAQCLIHASATGPANSGQDTLLTSSFPFVIQAGASNPLGVPASTNISSSTSIVSLPIYQSSGALPTGQQPDVTIIGFLQVFINYINADGSLNVTVLNVAGCGSPPAGQSAPSAFVTGSSPVPVRLITPPTP